MKVVMFVCTGNLCRSPMAEFLLRHKLEREGKAAEVSVVSVGVWTENGHPASPGALLEMARRGIDMRRHRSRIVTGALLRQADLVLTMTQNHAEALRTEFSSLSPRVHVFSEMIGRSYDVEDPYGGSPAEYERIARLLESLVEQGYPRILNLLKLG